MRSLHVRSRRACFEPLEKRFLLAATLIQDAVAENGPSGTSEVIDLTQFIDDPAVNTQVRFETDLGNIDLELFDSQKPTTVSNFLNYVKQGRYDGTIIHRVTKAETDGIGVIQGGGFLPFIPTQSQPEPDHIETDDPIVNEAPNDPVLSNLRGTIAMARTNDPNSATSEWFINTVDNTNLDPSAQPPGYAVFGEVINDSIGVADAIQALDTFQLSQTFASTPLRDVQQGQQEVTEANYVKLNAMTLPTKLTFTAQSSNPAVATVSVNGNHLTINYGPTVSVATITITGTDQQGGVITDTFTVVTGPPVDPTIDVTLGAPGGPISVAFTDADGTAGTVSLRGRGTTAVVKFKGAGLAETVAGKKSTVTGTPSAIQSIVFDNANSSASLTIFGTGGDGALNVEGLTTDGPLRSISARPVTFTGTLDVNGLLPKLDIGNLNNATVDLGGASSDRPTAITIGDAVSSTVRTNTPVKSFKANSFAAAQGAAAGQITARGMNKMTIAGDLANAVVINGILKNISVGGNVTGNISADIIGTVRIAGNLTDVTLRSIRAFAAREKPMGRVTIGGTVSGGLIRAEGNITSVTVGALDRTIIVAGVPPTTTGAQLPAPDNVNYFANPASIGSVTVKGTYARSNIVASRLGRINVGTLTTANNGIAFGIGSDRIAAVTGSAGGGVVTIRNLDSSTDVQNQIGDADLGDFDIVAVA